MLSLNQRVCLAGYKRQETHSVLVLSKSLSSQLLFDSTPVPAARVVVAVQ